MSPRLILPVAIAFGLVLSAETSTAGCVRDADCKAPRVCFEGACKQLGPNESLLRIELAQPIGTTANLFLDERFVGELPWSGVVAAGMHAIRVEAYGKLPSSFQGLSRGGQTELVQVTLEPDPAFGAPAQQPAYGGQPQQTTQPRPPPAGDGGWQPGMLSLALFGGVSYGTAAWGADQSMRPATALVGGGAFGVRVLQDPFWLELGVAVSSQSIRIEEWIEDWGKFLMLKFGLLVRMLFEVVDETVLIGAELEPGYGLSNRRFGYGALRFATSIFATEWLEFRINLGGVFDQELTGKGWIFGAQLIGGVAFRFVD